MTDESAAVVGLSIVLVIILFIGWWFGWKAVVWILIIAAIAISVLVSMSNRK